ncbi:MAG TPA: patatin-like phospholipase family protein [Mycobacteriales bacterium]|nr:patatin-like phospholipase family protein [Mycobacteriales bacterium]
MSRTADAGPRRALVLGGGGVLGAAWMIGALHAVSEAYDWDPRAAEILVGTSAGSVLAGLLGCGIGVDTLVNHQRGVPAPGDPHIDFNHDTASGGALPPRPQLRLGSAALLAHAARNPRRHPPLAILSALAPRGRARLDAVHELMQAVNPDGGWAPHPNTWIVTMDYETGRRVAFGRTGAPAADLADAVTASCSIPGWYEPALIGGRRYVDGGTCSPTSLDLLAGVGLDEVVVLAPMASFDYDDPPSLVGRLERRFRRAMTKRILHEAGKVRRRGTTVTVLGPGREDLAAIGVNLMDHRRRLDVFETSLRTSAAAMAGGSSASPAA